MSIIDTRLLEQLSELIGGDKSELHELIYTFSEEGSEIVDSMKESLKDEDLDVLRRGAHSIKSSAQDFGAIALSELNASLESQCKTSWPSNAEGQVDDIEKQFLMVQAELQRYIDENK